MNARKYLKKILYFSALVLWASVELVVLLPLFLPMMSAQLGIYVDPLSIGYLRREILLRKSILSVISIPVNYMTLLFYENDACYMMYLEKCGYGEYIHRLYYEELKSVALAETRGLNSSVDKAKALMQWVYENMHNVLAEKEYPCIRVANSWRYPGFVLATKCGACGDYAALYMALVNICGIEARYVGMVERGSGRNHAVVEVLIDGKCIVVDSSINRFNVSRSFYAIWSYDYSKTIFTAIYPNGTCVDVTSLYRASISRS